MTSILTVGIAVTDFLFRVDEMPRKAEKYRARDAAIVGGGCAANAAVAISRLGGKVLLAARMGDDRIADIILQDLAAENVDCNLVRRFPGHRSSYSSIFIDNEGERQIVNYRDQSLPKDPEWIVSEAPADIAAVLADTRWPGGAARAAAFARARGIPCILDVEEPAREAEEALHLATHLAFSAQGLRDFARGRDLSAGLEQAVAETGCWCAVTDGPNGVTVLDGGGFRHYDAPPVDVIDTLGAGDVWHGAFALMLAEGRVEAEAIRFSNHAASLKCTRFGGREGAPTRDEVKAFMKETA